MLDDSMLRMTIDPLLHSLATCSTTPQLHQRLTHLFEVIDLDESKSISFEEMQVGFNKLASVVPGARVGDILSMEEFEAISRGGEYVIDWVRWCTIYIGIVYHRGQVFEALS